MSTKPPTPTNNTTESIITATQSSTSSSASIEQSNRKRVKRTVSSISLSPSKLTSADDTSIENKNKRQRIHTTIKVEFFKILFHLIRVTSSSFLNRLLNQHQHLLNKQIFHLERSIRNVLHQI